MNTKTAFNSEIIAALTFFATALLFGAQCEGLRFTSAVAPVTCAAVAAIAGLVVLKKGLSGQGEKTTANRREITSLLSMAVYVGAIHVFGFYIASAAFMMFTFLGVSGADKRNTLIALAYAAILVALTYLVFTVLLEYFVPMGMLFE